MNLKINFEVVGDGNDSDVLNFMSRLTAALAPTQVVHVGAPGGHPDTPALALDSFRPTGGDGSLPGVGDPGWDGIRETGDDDPEGLADDDDDNDTPAALAAAAAQHAQQPTVTVDKDGVPWDSRIHSSNQKQNKDGTWQRRRGVDDQFYAQVFEELKSRAGGGNPAPAAQTVAPQQTFQQPAAAVQQPAAAAGDAKWTFPTFIRKHNEALMAGRSTEESLANVLKAYNLASPPMLAANPHLIPEIATALGYVL